MTEHPAPGIFRFDEFELDTRTGELRRGGVTLPLQPQPAAVLSLLVQRAGQLVTRDEIQRTIWPDRTVDYEQGLNYAIRRIRSTIGDNAETPAFVETLPRRGYRFVAPVEGARPASPANPAPRGVMAPAIAAVLLLAVAASLIGLRRAATAPMPDDPAAREAYLIARDLVNTRDTAALRTASREFARVLEFEPDFVPALVGSGEAFLGLGEPAAARQALSRALELDETDADAHRLLAQLALFYDWDWDAARPHLVEAVRLAPGRAAAYQVRAYGLAATGELAKADEAMQTALRLDPLSSYVQADAGWIAYWAGRLDAAAARCTRTLEIEPGSESGHLCLLFVRVAQHDGAAARRAARDRMVSRGAAPSDLDVFDRAAEHGLEAYWSWEIGRLEAEAGRSPYDAFLLGLAYAQAGRDDEAFRELEVARQGRTPWMLWLDVEPRLAPLRHDPRWAGLVRRTGLPRPAAG